MVVGVKVGDDFIPIIEVVGPMMMHVVHGRLQGNNSTVNRIMRLRIDHSVHSK